MHAFKLIFLTVIFATSSQLALAEGWKEITEKMKMVAGKSAGIITKIKTDRDESEEANRVWISITYAKKLSDSQVSYGKNKTVVLKLRINKYSEERVGVELAFAEKPSLAGDQKLYLMSGELLFREGTRYFVGDVYSQTGLTEEDLRDNDEWYDVEDNEWKKFGTFVLSRVWIDPEYAKKEKEKRGGKSTASKTRSSSSSRSRSSSSGSSRSADVDISFDGKSGMSGGVPYNPNHPTKKHRYTKRYTGSKASGDFHSTQTYYRNGKKTTGHRVQITINGEPLSGTGDTYAEAMENARKKQVGGRR